MTKERIAYQESFRRYEKKFILSEAQYEAFLQHLDRCASVDRYGKTTIFNIYYDTPEWYLVRRSIEGPVYKEKLRLRTYGAPDPDPIAFVEIKKKYQDVVYKRRIALPYGDAVRYLATGIRKKFTDYTSEQIAREIDRFLRRYEGISPVMVICYDRVAWAGRKDPEFRVTFDAKIRYRTEDLDLTHGSGGTLLLDHGNRLMEIKIPEAMPLPTARALDAAGIRMCSYSKYGTGFRTMIARQNRTGGRSAALPFASPEGLHACAAES